MSSFNSYSIENSASLNESSTHSEHLPTMACANVKQAILAPDEVSKVELIRFYETDTFQEYHWCAPRQLVQSPILRKLGRLEDETTLVCECSQELLNILLRASIPVQNPGDALAVLAAYDYLLVKPSLTLLMETLKTLMSPLVRRAIVFPPKALLCELCNERNMLDLTARDAGATVPEIANMLMNGGYRGANSERIRTAISVTNDAGGQPYVHSPVAMAANFQYSLLSTLPSAHEHMALWKEYIEYCEAIARTLADMPSEEHEPPSTNEHDGRQIWPTHSNASIPYWSLKRERSYLQNLLVDAVMLIPDFLHGPEFVLLHADRLAKSIDAEILNWLHWRSFRILYAKEGSASTISEVPNISLDMIRSAQASFQTNRIPLADFFPFPRQSTSSAYILPWSTKKPREIYIPENLDVLHDRIYAAVPWMKTVWQQCPSAFLTGSLLMQSLAPMPDSPAATASDVDIFVSTFDELTSLAEVVRNAMEAYKDELINSGATNTEAIQFADVVEATQVSRTKFTIDASTTSMPDSMKLIFRCDMYINSLATVVRYHLPCVRCAVSNHQLFISPSCAIALATRVCIDYHYVASRLKTPYEIIAKKWLAGYNLIVNAREQRQLMAYLEQVVPQKYKRNLRYNSDNAMKTHSIKLYSFESLEQRYLSMRDSNHLK